MFQKRSLALCLLLAAACGGKKGGDSGSTESPPSPVTSPPATTPIAPVILSPSSSYISKTSPLVISGSCETGNVVNLSGDSTDSTTCASSSFSFTVNKSTDGSYNLSVTQTNGSGNTSSASSVNWVLDTVAPSSPTVTSPNSNPFTSGDSSLTITGACETGATVSWSGPGVSGSGSCASGTYSFPVTQSTDSTYNYSISQTDAATNASSSTTFTWVRDSSVPSTPTITVPASSPFFSNLSSITISGACTTGDNVNIGGDVIAAEVTSPAGVTTQACTGSAYSFTVSKTADGTYTFTINQENTTSGAFSADASVVWVRDTSVPLAPVVSNPSTSPYTTSGNLTISGTCESNATVNLTGADTQSTTCSSGAYTFTVVKSTDATYDFSLAQTDRAGNASSSTALQWIRDSSVTPAPVVTSPALANYSSNTAGLTISGTCVTGNTVTLGGDITAPEVTTPAGSLTQTCASSAFSFTITKSADGTYALTLKQTATSTGDSALVSVNWTRDTTVPETTIATSPSDPNLNMNAVFTFSSADSTATFECQLDTGGYSACTSPVTYVAPATGSHTFSVRAKDSVGNTDASPATFTWTQSAYKTVALYHFTSGNALVDSSNYTGSDNNGLTDNNSTTAVTGKFTDGRNLASASSQFLSKADSNSLRSLNAVMTFEAQIRLASLPTNGNYMVIASKSGASGQMGWEVRIRRQGSNYYLTFHGSIDGTTMTEVRSSTIAVDTTSFHHVAVTWNKGSVKFYYDGVARSGGTIGTGSVSLFASNAAFRIGRTETMSSSVGYFNGVIDEVRLSQVLRWSAGFTAPTAEYSTVD